MEPGTTVDDPQLAKLKGVGGWLSLFLFGCAISPIVVGVSLVESWGDISSVQLSRLEVYLPFMSVARGFEVGGGVLLSVAFWALAVQLIRGRKSSAPLAVVVLTCTAAFYSADLVLTVSMEGGLRALYAAAGQAPPTESFGTSYASVGRSVVWSLIWLLYFLRSKRVQATFGSVTWNRVGDWLRGRPQPTTSRLPAPGPEGA